MASSAEQGTPHIDDAPTALAAIALAAVSSAQGKLAPPSIVIV